MNKYWEKRALQHEIESQLTANKYLAKMDVRLKEAQQEIIRQITAFYVRYANDNKITLTDARKYLTSKEMKEFIDVDLQRFRAMSLSNNPDFENLLNAVSYRVRILRLEALMAHIELIMLDLYGGKDGLQDYTYTGLAAVYQDSYYRSMFDFTMAGIPGNVQIITDDIMKDVLSYNWSGKEFSKRIWGHEKSTLENIRKTLEASFAAGYSIDRTSKELIDKTGVAYDRAEALVRTESNFFHNHAAQKSYKDAGIERYEILATLDQRTTDICRDQDGEIYFTKDYSPGTNAPPFHVRCRTTTVAYFDEEEYMEDEKRQSVDGLVDTMTYEEWYEKNVVGNHENEVKEKMINNRFSDKTQHKKYKEVLGKDVPGSFAAFQELKYNKVEEWKKLKGDYRKLNAYNKITANEPKITSDLQNISKKTGVEMVGLEYRLKTKESYMRKVTSDSKHSLDPEIISETIAKTNDVIRYTFQSPGDKLTDSYFKVLEEIHKMDYAKVKIKNTWNDKRNPYKGVNGIFITPEGQKFEVQFHTPESFELKNGKMHTLYEEFRLDTTSPERRAEITREMFKLSASLVKPLDIDKIK
ncbi:minor capsid protein [Cytobacillus sp. Hm23]